MKTSATILILKRRWVKTTPAKRVVFSALASIVLIAFLTVLFIPYVALAALYISGLVALTAIGAGAAYALESTTRPKKREKHNDTNEPRL